MNGESSERESVELLREIRDGQREIIALLKQNRDLAQEQLGRSREKVEESIGLQKVALQRQRTVTLIAVPGIVACIAAIVYLLVRYF